MTVPQLALEEQLQVLEDACDAAILAPSVHNSQPWTIVVHRDRLELRADRSSQLTALDPAGRELVQSLGAALFNARVSLAAHGWGVQVERFPRPDDPDLAAVVRRGPGRPEPRLPALAPAVHQRRTHRAAFLPEEVPDELLDHLAAAAAAEECELVAPLSPEDRRLLARLTREADAVLQRDPASSVDLRRWRPQPGPLNGRRTIDSATGEDRTYVLLATRADDAPAWLRAGEAVERVLLEVTRLGWAASPMTQALEVQHTRAQVRSAITRGRHPQMLLRIGFPETHSASPRRDRSEVVRNVARSPGAAAPLGHATRARAAEGAHRAVSDGRGGTTWI